MERELLEDILSWLRHAPLESGVCCCGDAIDAHNMGSGHAPVDDLAYSAHQLEERILSVLKTPKN